MTIRKTEGHPTINLDGPDGNVFVLIGYARNFARQIGLDGKAIVTEMMSGDYTNAVKVFEKNFGSVVTLETNNPALLEQLGESKGLLNE